MTRDLEKCQVRMTVDDQRVIGSQAFIAADSVGEWTEADADTRQTTGYLTDDSGFIHPDHPESFGTSRYF